MNSKLVAEWSTYNIALYSTQRPPPLGTVDTGEKLEQMAKEHLIKVASEGVTLVVDGFLKRIKLIDSLQVLSSMFSGALACGRPMKPIAKISTSGPLSLACCETALPVTWRYQSILLCNHCSNDANWVPDDYLRSQVQGSDAFGPDRGARYPSSRG